MYPNSFDNTSLISKLLGLGESLKIGQILDGTKKTLDVVSQAIPIYYQVKPIVSNAKTLFSIANIMNSDNKKEVVEKVSPTTNNTNKNSPIFYL